MDSTVSTLRTRLDAAGYPEATVARQGSDRIRVEIPDVEDPEAILEIIGTPAHLEFRDPNGKVVLEGHIKHCVRDGIEHGDAEKTIENFTKAVERFSNMG